MARKSAATFQAGDRVRRRVVGDATSWTVRWVSKCGELIATEYNGYFNTCDWASGYEKVSQS